MTHVTCRLTARNRDQLWNRMLGSQVWATFTFFYFPCWLPQGLRCSRCLYTAHCAGCVLPRDNSELGLQPGDHLAVQFVDVSVAQMDSARSVVDHRSMEMLRSAQPLTLYDCFRAFTERLAI